MILFPIIYVVLLIVAFSDQPRLSLKRSNFEMDLERMNSNYSKSIICGIISVLAAILPIADNLAKPSSYMESQLFHIDYGQEGPMICVFASWGIAIFWIIWMLANIGYKKNNAQKLEQMITDEEKRQAIITERKTAEENENRQVLEELTSKYGKPEQIIRILDTKIKNSFIVFPESQCIYIQSKVIPYGQVVSCEIKDDSYTTVTGTKEEVTKTNTGNMAGRAIVGGLIAGPVGAIVGGATAKKKTEVIDNTKTITHHHYYVVINLANVSSPMVRIDCGKTNPRIAEKIKAILLGIMPQRSAIQNSVVPQSIADELAKLALLKEKGILTDAEFTQQKERLLAAEPRPIEMTAENQMGVGVNSAGVYEDPVVTEVEEWLRAGMPQLAAKKYCEGKGCTKEEAQDFVDRFRLEHGL